MSHSTSSLLPQSFSPSLPPLTSSCIFHSPRHIIHFLNLLSLKQAFSPPPPPPYSIYQDHGFLVFIISRLHAAIPPTLKMGRAYAWHLNAPRDLGLPLIGKVRSDVSTVWPQCFSSSAYRSISVQTYLVSKFSKLSQSLLFLRSCSIEIISPAFSNVFKLDFSFGKRRLLFN